MSGISAVEVCCITHRLDHSLSSCLFSHCCFISPIDWVIPFFSHSFLVFLILFFFTPSSSSSFSSWVVDDFSSSAPPLLEERANDLSLCLLAYVRLLDAATVGLVESTRSLLIFTVLPKLAPPLVLLL